MLYTYDVGGNITSKAKYAYVAGDGDVGSPIETINYEYEDPNWKDKLTSFNGHTITYDEIGNPLNDGQWTYEWSQGRNLKQMMAGSTTVSYKYNDQGIRTEKTVNGVTTKYNISGDMVTWEKVGSNASIYYLYDANENLWGLNWNANNFFYVRNSQGDIIGIIDATGTTVVSYSYDAWGKIVNVSGSLANTLGQDNPYRYRGYRYDNETGLYYLNSRYYNPEWCRFVNEDILFSTGLGLLASNMFAYCLNNPVVYQDDTGYSPRVAREWWKEGELLSISRMISKPPINPSNYDDPDSQEEMDTFNKTKEQRGSSSYKKKAENKQIRDKFGSQRQDREEASGDLHEWKRTVGSPGNLNQPWGKLGKFLKIFSVKPMGIMVLAFSNIGKQTYLWKLPTLGLPGTGDGS